MSTESPQNSTIVSAAIYPGIGISRVGNSQEGYYLSPELPHPTPPPEGGYRDASGALKREVQRFRVYGLDADGQVVRELTAGDAAGEDIQIEWQVHVANRKAWWYDFVLAMDIPQARPAARRNKNFTGEERERLIIDPGPVTVIGCGETSGPLVGTFLTGTDLETDVYLGELRTDEAGRLLFFGGRGVSGSPAGSTANTFGNNDTWYDDISDGPVDAAVLIEGREIPVQGAWVVVAPPNYGPDFVSAPNLYDVMLNAFIGQWRMQPERPSFTHDIYPIFERFSVTQWVNQGFLTQFGWQAPFDFQNPQLLARLADAGDRSAELRRQVFNQFRVPQQLNSSIATKAPDNADQLGVNANAWPMMYGDDVSLSDPPANGFLPVTDLMYQFLAQWADGDFVDDWDGPPQRAESLDDVDLVDQPDTLDEAAMTWCLGGPFHPGCEMTWPVRNSSMFTAPFRFRRRPDGDPEVDYGDVLMPKQVYNGGPVVGGPLFFNGPGDISRWMAVPWQTDTSSCRSGYDTDFDPYLPTFWPARVPNQVLTEESYRTVLDPDQPLDTRLDAFASRAVWYRWLGPDWDYIGQINNMVKIFGDLGVLEKRPGPTDPEGEKHFPREIWVEVVGPELEEKMGPVPDRQGLQVMSMDRMQSRAADV